MSRNAPMSTPFLQAAVMLLALIGLLATLAVVTAPAVMASAADLDRSAPRAEPSEPRQT